MAKVIKFKRPTAEGIPAQDDTPNQGDWLELLHEYEHKIDLDHWNHGDPFSDHEGPLVECVPAPNNPRALRKKRWVLVYVAHRGSNYLRLARLPIEAYRTVSRVHINDWPERCRRVDNAEARLREGALFWQRKLQEAIRKISALMGSLGLGTQLAPATQALALRVGSEGPEQYQTALEAGREDLHKLHKLVEHASERLTAWMNAPALPLEAQRERLEDQLDLIDNRILGVSLYAGLGEHAIRIRKGRPAKTDEPLHLRQAMRFMDEECLMHYRTGGMDFKSIAAFDRWLAKKENFNRVFPHPRTAVAFRIRRFPKNRYPANFFDFIRIQHEAKQDELTFLYVRNGAELWRVATEHDFGEQLFPDRTQTLWAQGEPIWCTENASVMRSEEELRATYGEEFRREAKKRGLHPFNDTSVYFDDILEAITRQIDDYNRVAVILQGLLDRSSVLSPHPPTQIWNKEDFDRFLRLMYDDDRAVTDGPPPDFEAYRRRLNESIQKGSFVIGQEQVWIDRERLRLSNAETRRTGRYVSYHWWWPDNDNLGPGFIAQVQTMYGGECRFDWKRKGQKQRPGSQPYEENYPQVPESIRVQTKHLFNVSAYQPGDLRRFIDDPRTRRDYAKMVPLLAAEDWHQQQRQFTPPIGSKPTKKRTKKRAKKRSTTRTQHL